jgi:hypothetical protein
VANTKQKPVPEGVKRSPGKSKFSIPRKEAPPIDGSYLDRLFADYDRQAQELQGQSGDAAPVPLVESPESPAVIESARPEAVEAAALDTPAAAVSEISEQTPPAEPTSFPLQDETAAREAAPAATVWPVAAPATGATETVARIPQRRPAPVAPAAPDGDAQLLDRWKKKHRLGKGEVKVLRAMLGMCREASGDTCYVKIPQLMQAAELKERQTQLVIRSLRELGLIEKVAEYSNLDRLGTGYRVVLDAD